MAALHSVSLEAATAELGILLNGLASRLPGGRSPPPASHSAAADLARDLPVCLILSSGFFLFNWGLRLAVVGPGVKWLFKMRPQMVVKCTQSFMEVIFYGGFSFIGVFVVQAQPWVWPSINWWVGFIEPGHAVMGPDVRCYYIMYMARYFQQIVSVLLEPKRKDFTEMLIHHLVTAVVVYVSYVHAWNRVGVITMMLMDPADVPLHLAKVCKYAREATKSRWWQTCADRLFECFAVCFFVTRLVMYSYVCWSTFFEGRHHVHVWYENIPALTCFGLLLVLLALQMYWFFLIIRVAIRLAQGTPVEDIRSDDEKEVKSPGPPRTKEESYFTVYCATILSVVLSAALGRQALASPPLLQETQMLIRGLLVVLMQGPANLLPSGSGPSALAAATKALPHSTPDMDMDRPIFAIFCTGLFLFNWCTRLFLVEPLARASMKLDKAQLRKLAQSVMEAVFYGSFAYIGLCVVPSQEWVWPSAHWWKGFAEGGHEVMRADLRCYYILYMARYLQAIFSVLLEPKRKDFAEMCIHHVVTVAVIYISYVYGWNRVGVVVMALLDPADVPLHMAKVCKYTAEATKKQFWQFFADRLFEIFAIVFFITRLALYGYVCWSAHIEATRYFPKGVPEWTCVALLYTLLFLQVYWFFLILKVAVRLVRGQGVEDPRSDDEDEASPSEKKQK